MRAARTIARGAATSSTRKRIARQRRRGPPIRRATKAVDAPHPSPPGPPVGLGGKRALRHCRRGRQPTCSRLAVGTHEAGGTASHGVVGQPAHASCPDSVTSLHDRRWHAQQPCPLVPHASCMAPACAMTEDRSYMTWRRFDFLSGTVGALCSRVCR